MPQSRQLSAIMFTDIEGFTAIMQKNEMAALAIKDRHRLILETEHRNFEGKIIQYYGDGTLSIFNSVIQAVRCAINMQQFFREEPMVPLRIAIHTGDIIINDGDIFGDGVNLASRIESLGVPGCLLISDKVNDELSNHPEFKTVSMGTYQFKNVQREIEVFAIDHEGLTLPQADSLKGKTKEKKSTPFYSSAPEKSIAVLPFVNMSNDPEQEYFSDGIAEEILNSLAHLNDIKVAGRSSSFQFKGKTIDFNEVGRKLNVRNVLEGSVRKQGNKLRVTAQLINVEDGFHLWSERYDRDMDDIFAIQDEIAIAITEKLKITLLDKERKTMIKTPTDSNEAYDLYLKGRFYWNRRGPGLKKGLEYFLQAIAKDPEFGIAHAGIADTYALLAFYSILPPHVAIPKAKQAAEKAISLDPSRVEAYSVLAFVTAFYEFDWEAAKKQFQKAFAINPGYAPTHYWYSNFISFVYKDAALAIQEANIAIELEPLLSHSYNVLSSAHLCNGTFEEARQASLIAVELDANSFLSYNSLSLSLAGLKKYEEAIETVKTGVNISGRHQYSLFQLSWFYSLVGKTAEAQKIFDELVLRSSTEFISGLSLCVAAFSSGNYDRAVEFLELAFEQRAGLLPSIEGYPVFSFIKKDPRFSPIIKKLKYPE